MWFCLVNTPVTLVSRIIKNVRRKMSLSMTHRNQVEVVYVTIETPGFRLFLYLTSVHFRGELQQVGDVSEQKFKC